MRRSRTLAGRFGTALVALLCATCVAYGGLAPTDAASNTSLQSSNVPSQFAANSSAGVQSLADLNALLGCPGSGLLDAVRPGAALPVAAAPDADGFQELPPAPSSLALVLSALASLGAYQGARSLKRLHLSFTPDWYHTGGPLQVGHATPLQLEFDHAALAICTFDEPVARPAFAYRIPREHRSRLQPQFLLVIESPRGPPLLVW